jgi:ABC-2 type transport system permease protein
MIVFPVVIIYFFTSMMDEGLPEDMPCGIVDLDNTPTTRTLVRTLDAFQSTHVIGRYNSVSEARQAIQRGDIYGFLYLPKGTTRELLSAQQPKVSFYYSAVTMVAGNMLFRDLTTVTKLGSAKVGAAKLSMLGKSPDEMQTFLQPITIDLHMIGNPWSNYNVYLSSIMIPGVLILFMFLITAYSIGTELKFKRAHDWMRMADNNVWIALTGKILPQFLIFSMIMFGYMWYLYGYLEFPHPGGTSHIVLLAVLTVMASEGFGIFAFGLMPSLRLSMSVCSLWAVLGFSACGATYPVFAMDSMIEAIAQLIPLRHYYMVYQIAIFNDYPLIDAWYNVVMLITFACLPILVARHIKKAMLEYIYIP